MNSIDPISDSTIDTQTALRLMAKALGSMLSQWPTGEGMAIIDDKTNENYVIFVDDDLLKIELTGPITPDNDCGVAMIFKDEKLAEEYIKSAKTKMN